MKLRVYAVALAVALAFTLNASANSPAKEKKNGNPAIVKLEAKLNANTDNQLHNSFYSYAATVPALQTIVGKDGGVCVFDAVNATAYEFSSDMKPLASYKFHKEFDKVGAIAKDSNGYYYVFYSREVEEGAFDEENMCLVKYSPKGETLKEFRLAAQTANEKWAQGYSGVKTPFASGSCRIEISGDMIAVYFARKQFKGADGSGHQASYGFILDKNTFERLSRGSAPSETFYMDEIRDQQSQKLLKTPSAGHSFNQFILPVDDGFIFTDHGDSNPRAFAFEKVVKGRSNISATAFTFDGGYGENITAAELGGMAKTPGGYIFLGSYDKRGFELSTKAPYYRNLFVLTLSENFTVVGSPIWLTDYSSKNGLCAVTPKIVQIGASKYLLMWECYANNSAGNAANNTGNNVAGIGGSNGAVIDSGGKGGRAGDVDASIGYGGLGHIKTYMAIVDEKGNMTSQPREVQGARLNGYDILRYSSATGLAHWAVSAGDGGISVYSLDPFADTDKSVETKVERIPAGAPTAATQPADEPGAQAADGAETDAHSSNADISDAHASNANVLDDHAKSAHVSDLHISSADVSDDHTSSADIPDAYALNANESDAHASSSYIIDDHAKSAHISDAHSSNADVSDAHSSNADVSDAPASSADILDDHAKSANVSDVRALGDPFDGY